MDKDFHIKGKAVVKGKGQGLALVLREPLSFLGELDINTGIITDGEGKGQSIVDKVLVYPCAKGSSGNWRFLVGLANEQNAPAAIINLERPGFTEVQGAIIAKIPFMCKLERDPFELIETGDFVIVDAIQGIVVIKKNGKAA
jgi:predicted aconitase with swiveling domain